MALKQTTANISFVTESPSSDLTIELDDQRNMEVYGEENKSLFLPNQTAYLRVLTASSEPYEIYTSVDSASVARAATNVPYDMTDEVSFALESEGSISHLPIYGSMSYNWLGTDPDFDPLFDGTSITLRENVVAILQCEYQTMGDRWALTVPSSVPDLAEVDELDVLVVVVQGDNKASCTVRYGGEGYLPQPVSIKIADFCYDATSIVLEEVDVYLNGAFIGRTNAAGRLYLGELIPGTSYSLRMTKIGYVDSNEDVLHNDSFTIPTPS